MKDSIKYKNVILGLEYNIKNKNSKILYFPIPETKEDEEKLINLIVKDILKKHIKNI